MIQEDKDLLIKDLYARVPHNVKILVQVWDEREMEYLDKVDILYSVNSDYRIETVDEEYCDFYISEIKPYLFPLSSMTAEQKTSHNFLKHSAHANPIKLIDFYNKHHLDYRGLIHMGLAIDATNKNIY